MRLSANLNSREASLKGASAHHELDLKIVCVEQQEAGGLWDFGPRPADTKEVPLSGNWRKRITRRIDYSVAILRFLRNFAEYRSV